MRRFAPVLVALGAAATLLALYAALGGGRYEPTPVADPCVVRERTPGGGTEAALEQVVLATVEAAACELEVSREDLVLSLRDKAALEQFADRNGITRSDAEQALTRSLTAALDDAERSGALPGLVVGLVRGAVERVPPWLVLDLIDRMRSLVT